MTNNELLSKTISWLRFPLMVGIVFIHFNISQNPFSLHNVEYGVGYPEWYHCIINFFSDVLPRIGVPLFFFFSGFLFFYHTDFNVEAYKKKLKSRVRTLLVPYLLWNLIAIVWLAVRMVPPMSALFPNIHKIGLDLSLPAILQTFWNTNEDMFVMPIEDALERTTHNIFPIDGTMWYVRDLMIAVLCAPLFYWLIKKAKYYPVIVSGLLWYVLKPLDLGHPSMLVTAFFFFSWGAYYSINRLDFTALFRKLPFAPFAYLVVAIVDTFTKGQDYNSYIHMVGIVLGIISAVSITAALLERKRIRVNEFLANASFFLFALHTLFMSEVGKVVFLLVHADSPWFFLFFYFLVPALTILISLALYKGLKKCLPSFLMTLTGGR